MGAPQTSCKSGYKQNSKDGGRLKKKARIAVHATYEVQQHRLKISQITPERQKVG